MTSRPFLLLLACFFLTNSASATIVERIVAVVGERAILLSDLRKRARPVLLEVYQKTPPGARRAAAISQSYKLTLQRMIIDEIAQREANRRRLVVTSKELNAALTRVAAQRNMSVVQLFNTAKQQGLTEGEVRSEIRRQAVQAKLVNLRLQGRIRVTEEDLRSEYRTLVLDERRKLLFTGAWIRIDIPIGQNKAARQRGEKIAKRTLTGENFAALAAQNSDDEKTRSQGGQLGRLKPGRLPRTLDYAFLNLSRGEVSRPIRLGTSYYILKLIEREESNLPSFF